MSTRLALAITAQDAATLEAQLEAVVKKHNEINEKYNAVVKERDALLAQKEKVEGIE